jgi:hypothetical protein
MARAYAMIMMRICGVSVYTVPPMSFAPAEK